MWVQSSVVVVVNGMYAKQLKTRPLLTKAITSGFLFAIGDTIAQRLKKIDDFGRSVAFTSYGLFVHAPSQHYWFPWMERTIATGSVWTTRPMIQATIRVAVHTFTYAPISIVAVFTWMSVSTGGRTLIAPSIIYHVNP